MNKKIEEQIKTFLPFETSEGAWRRIEVLEAENKKIVETMMELAVYFRNVVAEPREIYLSVQEVRSLTVYVRWRKKGSKGQQSYLIMSGLEGKGFLMRQSKTMQAVYQEFNQMALDLNLAHSLRLNGIRRLRQYLGDLIVT